MFGLFKKKTEIEVLKEKYRKLLDEAFKLSHSDRKASDLKTAEAEEIMQRIEQLAKETEG
ncbi:Lacal_2735 family protein [Flexithrix dorotheae]|uniref:Lacal_2735 family protein n=1 Tax=Flexithrix dorotheae TaxID=70993 RepID=UPI00036D83EF|nr:Lacal_2735 family protein [Flexithrix dorotheae]